MLNKILFGSALIAVLSYLIMGVYCAQETVLGDSEVTKVKKSVEGKNWKDICGDLKPIGEVDGRTNYTYDCKGVLDEDAQRMKKAIENFQARSSGVIIYKVPVRLYNRVWNDPALEPIRVYGVDLLWPFREGPPPAEEEALEAEH